VATTITPVTSTALAVEAMAAAVAAASTTVKATAAAAMVVVAATVEPVRARTVVVRVT
jgi:hypothetical protein